MTTCYVITDSYGNYSSPSFPAVFGARMGWTMTVDAVPGSRYLQIPNIGDNFRARVPAALAAVPDVVLVAGSINDQYQPIADVVAEAKLCWAALASVPKLYVALFSSSDAGNYGSAHLATLGDALTVAASAVGVRFIDGVGWINGTGTAASPTGNGNGDAYADTDSHPNAAGAAYLGTRLAFAIAPPATGLDL